MDIIYDIARLGATKFLFTETVNSDTPLFELVLTDPWTGNEKTAYVVPTGSDGDWTLTVTGIAQAYEDLNAAEIYFDHLGTWEVSINESGLLVREVKFQVFE